MDRINQGIEQAAERVLLSAPFTETLMRTLRIGDGVSISGRLYTARDRVHRYLSEGGASPVDLTNAGIYHCGPVVMPAAGGGWRVLAAGPTTSIREEPYMADIIARLGVRLVIGKGGMGARTVAACRRYGCLYLQAVGGAAAWIARCVRQVEPVGFLEEFGATEAMWALDVEGFEAVVAIDADGGCRYDEVRHRSRRELDHLLAEADGSC